MVSISRWRYVPIVLLAVALALVGNFGTASAATGAGGNPALEQGLVKLQTRFNQLTQQLGAANAYAAQLDGQLADMRSRNQDTSRLAQSLAGFRNRLNLIRGALSSTQAGLARRSGFDSSGRVSNADQAKATLNRIGASLGQITNLLDQANAVVRRDFSSKGPQSGPAPAPAPNLGGSTGGNATLEQGLVKLQTRFDQLTQQLKAADAYAVAVEAQLADMRSHNQDTTKFEQSLAGFRNRLNLIRGALSSTHADLARRSGFDSSGRVSNVDQAKATLNRIGASLGQITNLVDDAYTVIRRDIPAAPARPALP